MGPPHRDAARRGRDPPRLAIRVRLIEQPDPARSQGRACLLRQRGADGRSVPIAANGADQCALKVGRRIAGAPPGGDPVTDDGTVT
jgi:hypothetical protein